jgi:hypothetical protein
MTKTSDDIVNESVKALEACLRHYTGRGLDEASRLEIFDIVRRQQPKQSKEHNSYMEQYIEQSNTEEYKEFYRRYPQG